ncbi:MAG: Uma2 family endonuclease [Pirellulales bacterium]
MSTQPVPYLTPADYLAIERKSDVKHEYYRGEMFAMAGATREHGLITLNIGANIHAQLASRKCEVFTSDMRVKVDETGLYTYPDVVATCEQACFEDLRGDTLLNPQLVIEVLSDSTENYDRGKKFEHYRRIASLREYVLISQEEPHVELYSRQADGGWLLTEAKGLEATIELPAIKCRLKLAEVYAKVEFRAT